MVRSRTCGTVFPPPEGDTLPLRATSLCVQSKTFFGLGSHSWIFKMKTAAKLVTSPAKEQENNK